MKIMFSLFFLNFSFSTNRSFFGTLFRIFEAFFQNLVLSVTFLKINFTKIVPYLALQVDQKVRFFKKGLIKKMSFDILKLYGEKKYYT